MWLGRDGVLIFELPLLLRAEDDDALLSSPDRDGLRRDRWRVDRTLFCGRLRSCFGCRRLCRRRRESCDDDDDDVVLLLSLSLRLDDD